MTSTKEYRRLRIWNIAYSGLSNLLLQHALLTSILVVGVATSN
ncbi:hypothetical protein OAL59_02975 [Nitrosopumilus sp.]|nr:hypothetical protein [Nitrosopumilus sp.]